ncbi:MAG: 23S rRNA (guanosine(2251)-2'-O)-methyltransferase RlmB [Actinobacteria bacterium]|nr:23S rRNA (guanosine(2251)-2'-O)-methyltransferase RlmB [Actinomycetota bacterium]
MLYEKLYGINTIASLLDINSGKRKIYNIYVNEHKKKSPRIEELLKKAQKKGISIKIFNPEIFAGLFKENRNSGEEIKSSQGIAAEVSAYNYGQLETDLKKIVEKTKNDKNSLARPVLALLDGVTDSGNFGAILRNCSVFGIDGVIIPSNRSADVNSRTSRISSGALEEIKVYRVTNLVSTIKLLKNNGFWIYGTTLSDKLNVSPAGKSDYFFPAGIVFGSEEKGISNLVAKNCDFLVKVEQQGLMQSLNVSVCSGIMFYILKNFKS